MDESSQNTIETIRQLIAKSKLKAAILKTQEFLKNSPKLEQAILQAAHLQRIQQQVIDGTISKEDEGVAKSKISKNLLRLISEQPIQGAIPGIKDKIQQAEKGLTMVQYAEKIYNIKHIDKADFH